MPAEGAVLAVDGKALRGLHGDELPGAPVVAAYAVATGLVVGQRGVRNRPKASELAAGRELLADLDLAGKVVTGAALYAQRDLSRDIVAAGGDYLWVLKSNQPDTLAAVALLFREPPWGETFPEARQENRHGGRQERRWLRTSTALQDYLDWPGAQPVCCLERARSRRGETTAEWAYASASLPPERAGPAAAAEVVAGALGH